MHANNAIYAVIDTNVLVSSIFSGSGVSEVAIGKEDAYLVTGNQKHFPRKIFVVTPAQMVDILRNKGLLDT